MTPSKRISDRAFLACLLALMLRNSLGQPPDLFAPLAIYNGTWNVTAQHPWSGTPSGQVSHLVSRCERFTEYFACEQTVNSKVLGLIIYTAGTSAEAFHTRFISPAGLAAARGDLELRENHYVYLDKPGTGQKGPWSRVENFVQDHDHIRFEEYESTDEGKTWNKTNDGMETRTNP